MSPRLAHYSSLSRHSPGTSSCGTSWVRTSPSSESSASSTPFTTSASNAFPCSSNSSTLSESAPWTLDNPCKSPDCSPVRTPSLSNGSDTVSTLWLFPRTCSWSAPAVFTSPWTRQTSTRSNPGSEPTQINPQLFYQPLISY